MDTKRKNGNISADQNEDLEDTPPKPSFKKRYCTKTFWWAFTTARLPILEWLPRYDWKHHLLADLSAGLTLAFINVPQGLSFAVLAHAPLIFGLYTACFSSFVYSILGTAVVSAFGPVAVGSMLTGENVATYMTSLNMSAQPDGSENDEYLRSKYIATITFTIGAIYMVLFFLRLSVIRALFTKAFVSGFISGCCIHILIKTIKMLINVNVPTHYGYFVVVKNLKDLILGVPDTHIPTLILSLVVSLILLLNTFVLKKLVARVTSFVIPMEGVVLVASVLVSYYFEFNKKGFQVVGHIPSGMPHVTPLDPNLMPTVFPPAVTISMINLATTLSMVIAFNPGVLKANQEVFAMATSNLICSNFQCVTIGNSMMRTIVAINLGIKSQLATMFSCTILLFALLFAGPLFEPLPIAVLGCIIVTSIGQLLVTSIIQVPAIFRISIEDGLIWVTVFLMTTFTDINSGLIVGFVLTLRQLLIRVVGEQDAEAARNKREEEELKAIQSEQPEGKALLERRKLSVGDDH